jgi:hypothetical protein
MLHYCNGYTRIFQVYVQMFYLFQRMLQIFLSSCCKSRSGWCIYMHQCMLQAYVSIFAGVSYVCCKCLQRFSSVFRRFSKGFKRSFQVFHVVMLCILQLDVSKIDRDVIHGYVCETAVAAGDTEDGVSDVRDGAVPELGRLFASLLGRSLAHCARRSIAKWRYNLVAASVVVTDQAARQFLVGLCRRPFPSWKMPISSEGPDAQTAAQSDEGCV